MKSMIKKKSKEWPNWGIEEMTSSFEGLVIKKKTLLEAIKKIPREGRTFSNTIRALEESNYFVSDAIGWVDFLMYVSPDKKIRDKAQELVIKIQKELRPLEFDREIWKAIKEYRNKKEKIKAEDQKLLKDYYTSYKRRGFDLEEKKFKRLQDIYNKLSELSSKFSKNINECEDQIILSPKDAKDLPETYVNTLGKKGDKYVVTLSYPDYYSFMEYSSNERLRKLLAQKFNRRGGMRNLKLMEQILKLRYESSSLLGYENPARNYIEDEMAKSPNNVLKFLNRVRGSVSQASKENIQELIEEKKVYLNDKKAKLLYHDVSFYSRMLRERKLQLNKEEIKKHFQFEKVRDAVFEVYSELLSVSFKKKKGLLWHEDVEEFAVIDKGGKEIASFYMDMFPRAGKYGHAAAFSIIEGRKEGSIYVKPVSALVMNVPKAKKGQPSLLSHGEVTTFFHEFGHIMHQTLTRATYMSHSGTNVSRDFVEAPSQIFENWAWEKEIIKKFAFHFKNQKPMDGKLIDKLISARKFLKGYATARQLVFAYFDMSIHIKKSKSINEVFRTWQKKLVGMDFLEGDIPAASFGHFVGYSAGYYGYLWSEVYSADMYSIFKKEGVLNSKTGLRYRREILEKGSSRTLIDSVKAFLKRSPSSLPFSKELLG